MKIVYEIDGEKFWDNEITIQESILKFFETTPIEQVTDFTIGDWGEAYEETFEDQIFPELMKNRHRFTSLETLFIGDMGFEECEISWIQLCDLAPFINELPKLRKLTIKGSVNLALTELTSHTLESITLISGGLPKEVYQDVIQANIPRLKELVLYLGVEEYGSDITPQDLIPLLHNKVFPNLHSLGLCNSEQMDEIISLLVESPILGEIDHLDLSCGTLTDNGAQLLLQCEHIKALNSLVIDYHYLSDEMVLKLKRLPLNVTITDQQEPDEYDGEIYVSAKYTE